MLIEPLIYKSWKPINFFGVKDGMYQISNFGNVFSSAINRILVPAISNGYYTVYLSMNDGTRKCFYIHRLVAQAFIQNTNPYVLVEVNHKNLFRDDNFELNLEWVTKQENIEHELQHKDHGLEQIKAKGKWGDGASTYGENNGMAKFTESNVRIMLQAIQDGASYAEALIAAGFKPTENNRFNLSHIARGHRWKYLQKEYNIPKIIPKS